MRWRKIGETREWGAFETRCGKAKMCWVIVSGEKLFSAWVLKGSAWLLLGGRFTSGQEAGDACRTALADATAAQNATGRGSG